MKILKGDQLTSHLEKHIFFQYFIFEEIITTANAAKIKIYFIEPLSHYSTSPQQLESARIFVGEVHYHLSLPTLEKRFYLEFSNGSKHQIVLAAHESIDEVIALLQYFFKNYSR